MRNLRNLINTHICVRFLIVCDIVCLGHMHAYYMVRKLEYLANCNRLVYALFTAAPCLFYCLMGHFHAYHQSTPSFCPQRLITRKTNSSVLYLNQPDNGICWSFQKWHLPWLFVISDSRYSMPTSPFSKWYDFL